MAAPKALVEIKLKHHKSTKWQEVYASDVAGAKITNLYVHKSTFEKLAELPEEITVTITA